MQGLSIWLASNLRSEEPLTPSSLLSVQTVCFPRAPDAIHDLASNSQASTCNDGQCTGLHRRVDPRLRLSR